MGVLKGGEGRGCSFVVLGPKMRDSLANGREWMKKKTSNLPGFMFPSTHVNLSFDPNDLFPQLLQDPDLRLQPPLLLLRDLDTRLLIPSTPSLRHSA